MIPIVFFHRGNQDYLKCALNRVERYNDVSYLIGDESNKTLCKNWYDINTLNGRFLEFKEKYIHMSTNSEEFELACFQRYFSLYELMKKCNLERAIMLDSDILVTMSLGDLGIWSEKEVSFSVPLNQNEYEWVASPHVFYCTKNMLEKFTGYLLSAYTNQISKLEEKYHYHKEHNLKGGICDMTLLYLWSKEIEFLNLYDMSNYYFDHTMQERASFIWDKVLHMKKIRIKDGQMYLINADKKLIQPVVLHFQGSTKSIVKDLDSENSRIIMVLHRYFDLALRIKNKCTQKIKRKKL